MSSCNENWFTFIPFYHMELHSAGKTMSGHFTNTFYSMLYVTKNTQSLTILIFTTVMVLSLF